jgi:GT2 family glycosyltransferase
MEKITFCIPSKSNLRYLKSSIRSIRKNSTYDNEIIIWIDEDKDGTENWLKENKIKYLKNTESKPLGIAAGYNRCISAATTPIVCMFHADMFMGKNFDVNLIKHLKPKTIITGTRIEPPLHPPGLEKIIQPFGMYPEDFLEEEFNKFVENEQISSKDKITYGIFAPWVGYRDELLEIGMHDEVLHSYYEDSDMFNRMLLNGIQFIQSRDALVYHLTCRGGQFQDGVEKITDDKDFHYMRENSRKYYIKKWGSWIANNEYQHPILIPVYNKSIKIINSNPQLDQALEPWFNSGNDILVEADGTKFTQEDFNYIMSLNQIVEDSGEIGQFELGNLKITINKIEDKSKDLIFINNKP